MFALTKGRGAAQPAPAAVETPKPAPTVPNFDAELQFRRDVAAQAFWQPSLETRRQISARLLRPYLDPANRLGQGECELYFRARGRRDRTTLVDWLHREVERFGPRLGAHALVVPRGDFDEVLHYLTAEQCGPAEWADQMRALGHWPAGE